MRKTFWESNDQWGWMESLQFYSSILFNAQVHSSFFWSFSSLRISITDCPLHSSHCYFILPVKLFISLSSSSLFLFTLFNFPFLFSILSITFPLISSSSQSPQSDYLLLLFPLSLSIQLYLNRRKSSRSSLEVIQLSFHLLSIFPFLTQFSLPNSILYHTSLIYSIQFLVQFLNS